jgi:hypothetical protein
MSLLQQYQSFCSKLMTKKVKGVLQQHKSSRDLSALPNFV